MAGLFGSGSRAGSDVKRSTNVRFQSSVQGRPRAIGAGQNRAAGNLIWYGDFKAIPVAASSGGKGGGGTGKGKVGSYKYSASFIVSLGETIAAVATIFNGNQIDFLITPPSSVLADLAALGVTPVYGNHYGATVKVGDYAQTAWSYIASAHPSQALAYRGEALACFANLGLDTSPTLPNFNFEVLWALNSDVPAIGPDANPADWVTAFLSNADWGAGFPAALIGDMTAYQTWARATGMLVSPVLTDQTAANSHLADLMSGTVADFRWSNGLLTVVPYGDTPVTGNGVTFTPSVTPLYDLTAVDFLPNQGSIGGSGETTIGISMADPTQILNRVFVEYLDRSNLYNPVVLNQPDEPMIAAGAGTSSDVRACHFFCLGAAASMSAALQLHRSKATTVFQFTLPARFILPDVMDILTITEPALGLFRQAVRIREIQENADRTLTFTCEEFLGTITAPLYGRQASLGTGRNTNADPGDVLTPMIFEPTDELAGALEIWAAVTGADLTIWGGCNIWAAYDTAGTYVNVGTLYGASRMGVTTAVFPTIAAALAGPTIDVTHTLSVDLSESAGQLVSGLQADMLALNTALWIEGEYVAFQNATLTGADAYDLAPVLRGGFGSAIAAHPSGSRVARLDDGIFKLPFTQDRIGATIYLKFQSFNIYGGGLQDLASIAPYAYVIAGTALASPLPDITDLRLTYIDKTAALNWNEIQDFRTVRYEVRKGDSWAAANSLGTVAHPPFPSYGNGTYWVAPVAQPIAGLTVYGQNPQSLTVAGSTLVENVVATYDEVATGWLGTITGPGAINTGRLVTTAAGTVVYYEVPSAHYFDVLYSRPTRLTTDWKVVGAPVSDDILSNADFLATVDLLGSNNSQYVESWVEYAVLGAGSTDIFAPTDAFALPDAFTAAGTFSPWTRFAPGQVVGEFFKFRLAMISHDAGTVAVALTFSVTADVEDRIDHVTAHALASGGETFTFTPDGSATAVAFKGGAKGVNGSNLPAVQVTWNETAGDQLSITGLTLTSVTIQILNGGVGVARTITAFFQGW